METSEVRRRLNEAIERARRTAADRRTRGDEATREYGAFLDTIAIPMFRQLADALKAAGYRFTVFTPGGSVRLMSDKAAEDFIELSLDTSGTEPAVLLHTSRARGRRVIEGERPIGTGPIRDLSDTLLLEIVAKELEPYVER